MSLEFLEDKAFKNCIFLYSNDNKKLQKFHKFIVHKFKYKPLHLAAADVPLNKATYIRYHTYKDIDKKTFYPHRRTKPEYLTNISMIEFLKRL